MAGHYYEVRVHGPVPPQVLADLGATTTLESAQTVLSAVCDQSSLYGLLARLGNLGLEVVEVRRVGDAPR